jgi:hypothetical protein
LLGDAKRQSSLTDADQLRHRLSGPGNHDGFALLDEFEQPGELVLAS